MATIDHPSPTANAPSREGRRRVRWDRDQLFKLVDLGFFRDRHVELIGGEIYEMVTNPPHDTAVNLVNEATRAAFGPGFFVRIQMTLDLGRHNQFVPDIAVVPGTIRDYARVHPKGASLLVEVSDSTLRQDRGVKAHRYAQAGIADYWIVNLVDRQLEIRRNPGPDPSREGRFRYGEVAIVPADGSVAPLAATGRPIAVADLLP